MGVFKRDGCEKRASPIHLTSPTTMRTKRLKVHLWWVHVCCDSTKIAKVSDFCETENLEIESNTRLFLIHKMFTCSSNECIAMRTSRLKVR